MEVLKTEALTKIYGEADNRVAALENANLSVEQGEFAAIVGTSGSGKSTLLHMLGGLDRPTSGKVFVENKDIFSLKDEALTIFRRRKIGFVFQSFNLVPTLNVYENIVFPIQLDGNDVDEKFVSEVIRSLGLESMQERSFKLFTSSVSFGVSPYIMVNNTSTSEEETKLSISFA